MDSFDAPLLKYYLLCPVIEQLFLWEIQLATVHPV